MPPRPCDRGLSCGVQGLFPIIHFIPQVLLPLLTSCSPSVCLLTVSAVPCVINIHNICIASFHG